VAKLDRKPAENVAMAGAIIQILAGLLALFLWRFSGSSCAGVLMWQAFLGVPIALTALMYLRQQRLAEEEQEEWDRLVAERAAGGAKGRLFEEDEIQAFSARSRLRFFEKYLAPIISIVMAVAYAAVVLGIFFSGMIANTQINSDTALVSLAAMAGLTFVLFLIGMYAAGMARQAEWRPARPVAGYLMFSTLMGLLAFASLVMGFFKYPKPDDIIAWVMVAAMAVLSIEVLLNFILDFYRPRIEGVEQRAAYDSRLLGLLSEPGGFFRTISSTLDYQFGFRVSQTWFYRFIEQAIAPLILFQLITLYLLTCFVIVGPEQQGVVERLGRFVGTKDGEAMAFGADKAGVLQPGLHIKWPWPIERVYRFPANETKTIILGHAGEYKSGEKVLWTAKHYDTEYNIMVAAKDASATAGQVPVNLLVATASVRYRIEDVRKWYYSSPDPDAMLEALCNREVVKYLAGVDLLDVMGKGRAKASEDLQRNMQVAADSALKGGLGVKVLSVGLEEMHPPVEENLPQSFHEIVQNVTQKEVDVLNAEIEAAAIIQNAKAESEAIRQSARGYFASKKAVAEGEAKRFEMQCKSYAQRADVFMVRELMSAVEKSMEDSRKVVIAVRHIDTENLRLNLEDPARPDILGVGQFEKPIMPENEKKK
jgi:regulator of protease activity HflC (stomatin/prohibitin superfamily)